MTTSILSTFGRRIRPDMWQDFLQAHLAHPPEGKPADEAKNALLRTSLQSQPHKAVVSFLIKEGKTHTTLIRAPESFFGKTDIGKRTQQEWHVILADKLKLSANRSSGLRLFVSRNKNIAERCFNWLEATKKAVVVCFVSKPSIRDLPQEAKAAAICNASFKHFEEHLFDQFYVQVGDYS